MFPQPCQLLCNGLISALTFTKCCCNGHVHLTKLFFFPVVRILPTFALPMVSHAKILSQFIDDFDKYLARKPEILNPKGLSRCQRRKKQFAFVSWLFRDEWGMLLVPLCSSCNICCVLPVLSPNVGESSRKVFADKLIKSFWFAQAHFYQPSLLWGSLGIGWLKIRS